MRRGKLAVAIFTAAALAAPIGAGASTAQDTEVDIGEATVIGSTIEVSGTVTYGADATGNTVLATDPAGDALVNGAGFDLASVSVRPNIAGRQLIWTLGLHDGLPDPVDGPPPAFTGYHIPITVDDQNTFRWLGAGTTGSAVGAPSTWVGLCHNQAAGGGSGGWNCPGHPLGSAAGTFMYTGSITASGVTWTQPFAQMSPQIQYGSVISQGSILCGAPCSFAWPPGLVGALAPVDTIGFMQSYKVPGEVRLGIAPLGVTPTPGIFTTPATFDGTTGAISGSVSAPAPGATYVVHARTCYGLADSQTCVVGSSEPIEL